MAGLDVRSVLSQAVRLHQVGRLQQAAALYGEALAGDPNNADALHLLGMVALQQGQPKSAAELIGKAIRFHDREASGRERKPRETDRGSIAMQRKEKVVALVKRKIGLLGPYRRPGT